MKKYMDSDGDIWLGPDDATLFLKGKGGQMLGVGVSKPHIEKHYGKLVALEEPK